MNQRSRSSHGTAAFAGEVEGSTKSVRRAEHPLLEPVLGPLAEDAPVGLFPDERDDARLAARARSTSSRSRAPAKSAARRSLEPRVVRRAAFVSPMPKSSRVALLMGLEQPRREPGRVQQPPEVVARIREGGAGGRDSSTRG